MKWFQRRRRVQPTSETDLAYLQLQADLQDWAYGTHVKTEGEWKVLYCNDGTELARRKCQDN